jgi:DNA-binding FadR family transcriptional regulator
VAKALANKVSENLIDLVVTGEFPPEATLPSEVDLAKRFGVSRLTVREALSRLSDTRIIQTKHGRPSVVAPATEWSPLHPKLFLAQGIACGDPLLLPKRLLETRRIVEVGVAETAAAVIGRSSLTLLSKQLAEMVVTHEASDGLAFASADLAFHNTIFTAVDNPYVTALFGPIISVVTALRQQTSTVALIREHAIEFHSRILNALEARDGDAARREMLGHMLQTENDMVELIGTRYAETGNLSDLLIH